MLTRVPTIFAVPALVAGFAVTVVGLLTWRPLIVLAIPTAAFVSWIFWRRAHDAVLRRLDARPLGEIEGQRVLVIVERLCLASGLRQPNVRVIDDSAINLAIVSSTDNTLVATTGFLSELGPLEMEGAVAHCVSKIQAGFGVHETLMASAPWAVPSPIRRLIRSWDGGADEVVRFDLQGVNLTRYPPGLRRALQRTSDARTDVSGGEALGTAWLIPPLTDRIPTEYRVEVLGEL